MSNYKTLPAKALSVGDRFRFYGQVTVYTVTRPVTTGGGMASITYRVDAVGPQEFEVVKPALSTCQMMGF